jgi:tetratricopeptide (TPR) repeat protein
MDEETLSEVIRLEETERDFEGAIALLTDVIQRDPTCFEAYIHLAADSGILGKFRQAEYYARIALKLNPESGRARYYLGCALRDQYRLAEACEEMEKAVALPKREASAGTIGGALGVELPLTGWAAKVEQDFMSLSMQMLLKRTRERGSIHDVPDFIPLPGGMKTYRNDRHGFEIDIPSNWSVPDNLEGIERVFGPVPLTDAHDFLQFGCWDEAFNLVIGPIGTEPSLDDTELEFTIYAQDHSFRDLDFGRITVGGREHLWARYRIEDQMGIRWNKKYMIVFGGIEYSITGTCNDPQWFVDREQDWDAIIESFRLLVPIVGPDQDDSRTSRLLDRRRDLNERRLARRTVAGTLYGRAYDAVEMGNYPGARDLLEQCLAENPDHTLAHKEMAVVLKKLGDKRGALRHRMEVERLDPSDYGNRMDLVELLAGCGFRKEAMREVDELVELMPDDGNVQNLKASLVNKPRPNYRLLFILSIGYFLIVDWAALIGGIVQKIPWLVGFLCLPAAHYLNLSGRWVGLTRRMSNWLTVVLAFSTLAVLSLKADLSIILSVMFFGLVFPILADNALKD